MDTDKAKPVIVYGNPFCPAVGPVRAALFQSKVPYEYINIHEDENARERVREINNGYESVPTLVFPDGSTLTEPSGGQLHAKLKTMGYTMPLMARLTSNWYLIVIVAAVIFAILRSLGVL